MSNKGKKYIKLTGYEVATPESQARADEFLNWYAQNLHSLKRKLAHNGRTYDEDVASETAILIYDAIALKGAKVESFAHYFFRAYQTNALRAKQGESKYAAEVLRIDASVTIEAPTYDFAAFEKEADELSAEILQYVRENYAPLVCSLFEIYIGLQPETSYNKLSAMLGIPRSTIERNITAIRKDVAEAFSTRRDFIRTLI